MACPDMSCACLHGDTDKRMTDIVEAFEFSSKEANGIDYVVQLNVIGLTGIILDSTKTKESVSRDKNMLVPPRQMKASLVVIRDDKVYGMSSLSKGLIQSVAVPSSIVANGKLERKQRRYLAIWSNNKASNSHSSILFEADLSENSSCVPHKNFDVFIGLSAHIDSVTTTIPIGVASLPLAEAAALQGPSGKVVLDLPVYNLSPVQAESNNAFSKNLIGSDTSNEGTRKNKKGFFSSFRKRHMSRDTTAADPVLPSAPSVQASKKPCIYTLDSSQEDPSILRIELELHRKESNVEIGMSSDDFMNEGKGDAVSCDLENRNNFVLETATNNSVYEDRQSSSMEQFMEDQSFERVLSIRTKLTTPVKSRFLFYPTRRFRVKCIDRTSSKFELTPIRKNYDDEEPPQGSSSFLEQLKDSSLRDEHMDAKEHLFDLPIERVLSDSSLMVALAQMNETEDNSLQGNETLFDEKSFLSGDTTACKLEKEKTSPVNPKSDTKSEGVVTKSLKLHLFWRRRNTVKTSEAGNLSSVAGTESSNHSSSNSESTSEISVEISGNGEVKSSGDQLISVSSSSELICETPPKQAPVKFPVSILRTPSSLKHKGKESVCPLSRTSVESIEDLDMFQIRHANKECSSVVSSSANTAIFKNSSPFETDKVQEHSGDLCTSKLGIAKEASTSEQSLATRATTQLSPYSNSLPHFVEETTKPIILREKYEFQDENDFLKRKDTHSKMHSFHDAACTSSPDGVSGYDKSATNLAQSLYRFIDLQPCAGKIDPLLANDDEDFTIAESWTHNENSTLGTFEPPKETMHDDLADLGLLFDDMCRQSGFHALQDDLTVVSIMDDGTGRDTITSFFDRNRGKKRWLAAMGGSASKLLAESSTVSKQKTAGRASLLNADEDSDIAEQSLSIPSDQSSETSSDEQTLRSCAEESASLLCEQGTEVDLNDANLTSSAPDLVTPKAVRHHQAAKSASNNLKSRSRKLRYEYGNSSNAKFSEPASTRSVQSLSQNFMNSEKELVVPKFQEIQTEENVPIKTISMISNPLPPRDPNRRISPSQIPLTVKPKTKLIIPDWGDHSNGSRNESLTPSRKSIAQSFVDFVEYVITPLPSSNFTPSVPTLLHGDDAVSVGELTATTYERQIEVDEMRQKSLQQRSLSTGKLTPTIKDTYFAEYDGGVSPDVAAALEAAAVKKLAESWVDNTQ